MRPESHRTAGKNQFSVLSDQLSVVPACVSRYAQSSHTGSDHWPL